MTKFVYRGPRSFYFARKRYKLDSLKSRMAEHRTCHPGGGGSWYGNTGDGQAWHKNSDRTWFRTRKIVAGQWCGPWVYRRQDEVI